MGKDVSRSTFRLQSMVLAVGLLVMAAKFLAWFLTNSNAILTDALESIINILAGFFALFSLYFSARPRDRSHPYGHGKIEFVSAGFEGGLIFLAGLIIIAKSVYNLIYPQPLGPLDLGLVLVAGSGLVNYLLGWILIRRGKAYRSLVLRASGQHLRSDAYSSAGLVVGLALLFLTDWAWIDQVVALAFGAVILWTGFRLVRRATAGILDEADPALLGRLAAGLREARLPNWIDVHNLRLIQYGGTLHLDCHLTLPWYLDLRAAHDEVKRFEESVSDLCETPVELFIHTDPCLPPENCRVCSLPDCPKRQRPARETLPWTLDHLLENQPHVHALDKSPDTP